MKDFLIVGSGIAGTLLANRLSAHSKNVCLIESRPHLHQGASGNPLANVIPHFNKSGQLAEEINTCFAEAVRYYAEYPKAWAQTGALFLLHDKRSRERFSQGRPYFKDTATLLSPKEASAFAGVALGHDSLYVPSAGTIQPAILFRDLLTDSAIEIRTSSPVVSLSQQSNKTWSCQLFDGNTVEAETVILANAFDAKSFSQTEWLPLRQVRGQVCKLKETKESSTLKSLICFDGYLTPAVSHTHVIGGSYRHENFNDSPSAEETEELVGKLNQFLPSIAGLQPLEARSRVRNTTPDHLPIVGRAVDDQGRSVPGLFLCLGLGSRGFTWAPHLTQLLVKQILNPERAEDSEPFLSQFAPRRFVKA